MDRLYELLDDEFILQPLSLDTSDETDGNSFYGKKDNEDDILFNVYALELLRSQETFLTELRS